MNEQELQERVARQALNQLSEDQLEELKRLTDDPNVTPQQIAQFYQASGVDQLAIAQQILQNHQEENHDN